MSSSSSAGSTVEQAEQQLRAWLDDFVIDLNLCPFASSVIASDGLRIAVCESDQLQQVAETFVAELELIERSPESAIATTILALPNALLDFEDYLSFIDNAEALLEDSGNDSVIQLASFHPDYQFDGEALEAVSHFTNRSPYPLIHFLRVDMMATALATFPNPEAIPERNIATLEELGRPEIESRWNKFK